MGCTTAAALVLTEHRKNQETISKHLGRTLTDDGLVFCQDEGNPLLPDTVTTAWIRIMKKLGIKGIRLHDLRHSHASQLLKQGVHPKIVQERLGHSSIAVTLDTYSHVAPSLQRAAAERFDEVMRGWDKENANEKIR